MRNFLLDVLFFVNAVWSIRHRSGRREPQADDDSGSVGPCPSYPLRLVCSENPLSGCVGLGFERHLMPQPLEAFDVVTRHSFRVHAFEVIAS